jgi:hypothetical protein
MRILIIIPDGVGVRNYLFSNFISSFVKENNEVYIYHKLSNSAIKEIKKYKPEINNFKEIPGFIEKPKARILRESLAFARLLRNKKELNNNTILKFWNPSKKGIKKKILYFLSEILGFILSKSNKLIYKFDTIYEKEIEKDKITSFITKELLEINPDFVLNLHQRSIITAPIITAVKKINIKCGTVIFSWDNVPKAKLISRYDFYFVWSALMKNQLLKLYPEILTSQVKITGTPQFEFYFDEKLYQEKKQFFCKYGLDETKKTICFSGNDLSSPYESNYLNDICEELNKIEDKNRPQILFRQCPVDKSSRFNHVLKKYSHFVFPIHPDWRTEKEAEESFASIYPTPNDNFLLVNTVKHSDIVINLGSTVAHDFAVLDKPCLYVNYNPVRNPTFRVEDVFNFEHFKSMENLKAVGWINSKEEIKNKIISTLENPNKVGVDRKKWLSKIVLQPLSENSEVLKNTILKCI